MISGTQFLIVEFDQVAGLMEWGDRWPWAASDFADIAAQCRAGKSLCLSGPDGIVVVELKPQDDLLELWVRVAVGRVPGAFHRAEPDIVSIARDMGASTIAFGPGRRGWQRMLGPHWSLRGDEYVRPVDVKAQG